MKRRLRRIPNTGLGGVCAGIAYWLGIPVWIVRLIWIAAIFLYGTGLALYIILCIFMPEWEKTPDNFKKITGD